MDAVRALVRVQAGKKISKKPTWVTFATTAECLHMPASTTHSPFANKALSIVKAHPIVQSNSYTEWFAEGDASIEEAQHLVKQFSVFSNRECAGVACSFCSRPYAAPPVAVALSGLAAVTPAVIELGPEAFRRASAALSVAARAAAMRSAPSAGRQRSSSVWRSVPSGPASVM